MQGIAKGMALGGTMGGLAAACTLLEGNAHEVDEDELSGQTLRDPRKDAAVLTTTGFLAGGAFALIDRFFGRKATFGGLIGFAIGLGNDYPQSNPYANLQNAALASIYGAITGSLAPF